MSTVGGEKRGDLGRGHRCCWPLQLQPGARAREHVLPPCRLLLKGTDPVQQPQELLPALAGEVGELAELSVEALQEELSDVLIYLVALPACCRVDLLQAVLSDGHQPAMLPSTAVLRLFQPIY